MYVNFKNKIVIYGVLVWFGMSRVVIIMICGKIVVDVIKVFWI